MALSIRLTEEEKAFLDTISKTWQQPASAIIRMAIDYLAIEVRDHGLAAVISKIHKVPIEYPILDN